MNKHTQGPWKAVYVGCSDWDLDGPTTQEDWTLAAAAPDLLEAAKHALEVLDSKHDFQSANGRHMHYVVFQELLVAIAKATGSAT